MTRDESSALAVRRIGLVIGALVAIGLVIGGFVVAVGLFRDEPPEAGAGLRRPNAGEVRPDELADGTPVWVVGHEDGSVDVLSGFDTHRPFNLGKVLWWCARGAAFENPEHGSTYDEYGLKIGGPAPTGLPAYEVRVVGSRVIVGPLGAAPPPDAPHSGPSASDRDRCMGAGDGVVYHTFEGWQVWGSPTAAVEAAPEGWILLAGELALEDGQVVVCARSGCDDSARATHVEPPADPDMEFGPLIGERFIARVRDGALTDVTRVLPVSAP
jgi:hypothetical protein